MSEELEVDTPMPFGKYRGYAIETLPSSYLRWMTSALEEEYEAYANAAERELENRDKHGGHHEDDPR